MDIFELIFTVTYCTVLVDDRPHEPNTHVGKRNLLEARQRGESSVSEMV